MTSMEEGIQWLRRWGAMEGSGRAGILPTTALAQAERALHPGSTRQAPTSARLGFAPSRTVHNASLCDKDGRDVLCSPCQNSVGEHALVSDALYKSDVFRFPS